LYCGGPLSGGADLESSAGEYQQRIWRKEHGLPGNTVKAILQTRDGYLWVGTTEGLARFDGVRFVVFNRLNVPAFRNHHCTALAEDAEGSLWVGTADGLLRLRGGKFERVAVADVLEGDSVAGLWAGVGQSVSVLTRRELYRWGGTMFARLAGHGNGKVPLVTALHPDQSGKLLIGTSSLGLCELNNGAAGALERIVAPLLGAHRQSAVDVCFRTHDGRLWAYGNRYLTMKDGSDWVVHTNTHPAISGANTFLIADRPGNVWIGYEAAGLFRFRDGRFTHYDRASGLSDCWVLSFCEDREGNLWIGTEAGGLNRWQPTRFANLTPRDGLAHDNVWALCEARDGSVWIGTDGGVSRLKDGAFTTFDTNHSLSRNTVRALCEDRAGALWIGTGDGLNRLLDGKITMHPLPLERWGYKIRVIYEDRSSALWVGWEHGLARLKDGAWTQLSSVEDLQSRASVPPAPSAADITNHSPSAAPSHLDVRAILEDRRGALWLGTLNHGLIRWRDGEVTVFTSKEDGLASDSAWALHEDADGALWIGTAGGLNRFAHGRLHRFTTREGLPDDLVNQILEDDSGHLWISHDRGLYRVSKRALDDVASGRVRAVECATYDETDGMPSRETNGAKSQPAGIKTRDGRLWFPTTRGVAVIDPRKMSAPDPPPVVIESVRAVGNVVFGEEMIPGVRPSSGAETNERQTAQEKPNALGQAGVATPGNERTPLNTHARNSELQLAPGSGRLVEIHYTANSFVASEKVRFQYRLRGYDTNWTDAGPRRAAWFTNLRPGRYQFEVRARTHDGAWGENRATLAFHVAPFWYQRRTVHVLGALALLLAAWGVYRWRLAGQRRWHELEKQNALAREQARISGDIHDELGSSLTRQALLIEQAQRELNGQPAPRGPLEQLAGSTRELSHKVREIIWATNPACDTWSSLVAYVGQYATSFLGAADLPCRFDVPPALPPLALTGTARHHVFLVAKEALNNIVKHAAATEVWLRVAVDDGAVRLTIEDNGRGFAPDAAADANGLPGMRRRIERIGGRFELSSQRGRGTVISILVPTGGSAHARLKAVLPQAECARPRAQKGENQ
jgi:ligand-binding sensor domain-containing protein/signal transduction histidine kinase